MIITPSLCTILAYKSLEGAVYLFVYLFTNMIHFHVVGESSSLYFYYGGSVQMTLYICQKFPN